jgi:mannan endo-1,4-beta-mannosidase
MALACYGQAPAGAFSVRKYGAKGDGHTPDTRAIGKAVAACVKAGGGTVYVPAGKYVTGTIRLFSNINLYLAPGAVLLATEDNNDYGLQTDYGFSGSGAGGKKLGLVFADRAENVSITGTGVIDGRSELFMYRDSVQVSSPGDSRYTRQGAAYMNAPEGKAEAPLMWKGQFAERPGTEIIFHACKRVLVRDITIRNANDWSMDLNNCDDAKVLGISIDNNLSVPNSDGVDMYDSKNVIISDCDIRVGDDAIAVVSTSNLKVSNCSLCSRSCGIRVGYNGFNDNNSGNLLFDNIRIMGSNRGIGIFQRRKGNIENMLFSNMIIDTRLYPGQWWGHGEPVHISALPGLGSKEVGTISNIRFTNIIARGEEGIVLYGSPESELKDIRFENVQLTLARGKFTDLYGGNFDLRANDDPKHSLFSHDIPAIYARHVKGLTVQGLDLRWEGSLPGYFTNAIDCESFGDVTIADMRGDAAPNAGVGQAVIRLRDGKGAVIRDLHPAAGGGSRREWLEQRNVTGLSYQAGAGGGAGAAGSSVDAAAGSSVDAAAGSSVDAAAGSSAAAAGESYGQRPGSLAYMTAAADAHPGIAPKNFVQREGSHLVLDGQPYYFIGTNYWQGALLATGRFGKAGRQRVQRELSFLAAKGVKNLRIVAGAEGTGAINGSYRVGPSLQPKKGVFSEDALQGLDYLLSEMGKRNMKAVIYVSNNWDWSGGFLQYLNWNGLLPDSLFLRKLSWEELRDYTSRFYACAACQSDYFRQVRVLVGRTNSLTKKKYSTDPAIMAWELANEPRPMRPQANDDYRRWVAATAALIKSIDPWHLVTTGTEGMASTGDDLGLYKAIHDDKNIDYLTIHVWPKNWGFFSDTAIAAGMPVILRNTASYIDRHEAVAKSLDKPMVIEEFGLPRDRQAFDAASPDGLREKYYRRLFSIVRQSIAAKGNIAGCNFWAFGGEGRPVKGQTMWKKGDGYLGDPPMEEQGLNAVYDVDRGLWSVVKDFETAPPFAVQPFAVQQQLFRHVEAGARRVGRYGLFELTVDIAAPVANPYDYDERALRCVFAGPGGIRDTVDGFYMQDYSLDTATGLLKKNGLGHYKVRYSPRVAGQWNFMLFCSGKGAGAGGGLGTREPSGAVGGFGAGDLGARGSFSCLPSASPGFVRRNLSPYLSFDNGKAFIPIGENMAWAKSNPYMDYRRWVGRLADKKGNFIRVWMPSWGLGLEWQKGRNGYEGLMQYHQQNAWYLDWLVGLCAGKGVYMMLSLDHHGQVSTKVDANWNENPYNAANGGPCLNTWDFFTSDSARHLIRNRFRYIVARYGYSSYIQSWELFNEVDWTDDFEKHKGDVRAWHQEMAGWLSHLDVNHHLITTSYGRPENDPACWELPALDFTQSHYYSDRTAMDSQLVANARSYRKAYHKPTLNGEFGLMGDGRTQAAKDPGGIFVHNCLWATLFGGAMGAALPWYWDDYVEPQDLYVHFSALSAFAAGISLIGDGYAPVEQSTTGATLRVYLLRSADSSKLAGYLLNKQYDWQRVKEKGLPPAVRHPLLEVGMRDGSYIVSWSDCRTGAVVKKDRVSVKGGVLHAECPDVQWDVAVKVVREG